MHIRTLGRTGAKLSLLGFGCGAVGGLMVRGAPSDQERAVARALSLSTVQPLESTVAPLVGAANVVVVVGQDLAETTSP